MGCGFSRSDDVCCTDTKDSIVVENKQDVKTNVKEENNGSADGDQFQDLSQPKRFFKAQEIEKPEGSMQAQPIKTDSQINFFKMLDEKIENGIEFDEEQEDEHMRKEMMESVKKEWDNILGKSLDNQKSKSNAEYSVTDVSDDDDEKDNNENMSPTVITEVVVQQQQSG